MNGGLGAPAAVLRGLEAGLGRRCPSRRRRGYRGGGRRGRRHGQRWSRRFRHDLAQVSSGLGDRAGGQRRLLSEAANLAAGRVPAACLGLPELLAPQMRVSSHL
jgi:hypothetical protein